MNISMQLAVLAAVCVCLAEGAGGGRLARKNQRATRGFKNVEMMTARGFGKRAPPVRAEQDESRIRQFRRIFDPRADLMIAKDFGKRADSATGEEEEVRVTRGTFKPNSKVLIARGYGKRDPESNDGVYGLDNFWEQLEASPEREFIGEGNGEKIDSIPLDLFVNELLNNPDFARSVVRKFVDTNQDGMLSTEELLRNTA